MTTNRRIGRWSVGVGVATALALAGAAGCSSRNLPVELGVRAGADGSIEVGGWAAADGPSAVRITVDGKEVGRAPIDGGTRTARFWFSEQQQRSFATAVQVGPGKHFVCVIPVFEGGKRAGDGAATCRGIDLKAPSNPTSTTLPPAPVPTTAPPATSPTTAAPTTAAPTTAPPTTAPPAPAPAPIAPPAAPVDDWRASMLADVNARRAQAGLPALTACASLDRAAQGYAQLLNRTGHFDHVGPDGSTVGTRIEAAGYVRTGSRFGWAENIAKGQRSVQEVMDGWMNSSGHRANILSANLTHLGLGRDGNVWVQNFGTGGSC